jgi:FAD:protein FMN transferase
VAVRPHSPWRRRAKPLLGTLVDISLPRDTSDDDFTRATDAAFTRVAQVHAAMSFDETSSDLRAIARRPAGRTLRVSADTWAVLHQAQALEEISNGLFNVCVVAQMVRSGRLPAPGDARPVQARHLREALLLLPHHRVQVLVTP